jgi:hypothetical protein
MLTEKDHTSRQVVAQNTRQKDTTNNSSILGPGSEARHNVKNLLKHKNKDSDYDNRLRIHRHCHPAPICAAVCR